MLASQLKQVLAAYAFALMDSYKWICRSCVSSPELLDFRGFSPIDIHERDVDALVIIGRETHQYLVDGKMSAR